MADIVKSVEFVEFSMPYTDTLGSTALTKGQDVSNCVPFHTIEGGYDNQDCHMYDIWFPSSGTISFERSVARGTTTGDNHSIACYVVEFEPSEMHVQQGAFSIGPGSTSVQETTASSFDMSRTAMHHCYQSTSTNLYYADHQVRGSVSSNGVIDFDRGASGGIIAGHYYTFEATNSGISVWHYTSSYTATNSVRVAMNDLPVYNQHKAFSLSSYYSTDTTNGYLRSQTVRNFIRPGGVFSSDRDNTTGSIYVAWQFILFNDNKFHTFFPYHDTTLNSATYNSDFNTSGYVCENEDIRWTVDYAMPVVSMYGMSRHSYDSTGDISDTFVKVKITDSHTVFSEKVTQTHNTYLMYSIIDWKGIGPFDVGTNDSPMDREYSFAKSVQNGRCNINKCVNAVKLTKGQDPDNCIVFISFALAGGQDYQSYYLAEATIDSEYNLLLLNRYESGDLLYVDYSIVEFYPDLVKVQKGRLSTQETGLSYNVTVDEVALEKAFLIFNFLSSATSQNYSAHQMRGMFSNSTTLNFYKYENSFPKHISWYVVEDLGNNFRCKHLSGSTTGAITPEEDTVIDYYQCFSFLSYYPAYSLSSPYYGNFRSYYAWEFLPVYGEVYASSASYTHYYNIEVVYFIRNLDCLHCHQMTQSLSPGTNSVIGTWATNMNTNNVTLYNATSNSICMGNGNSSSYISETFATIKPTDYDTQSFEIFTGNASSYTRWTGFRVICWDNSYSLGPQIPPSTDTKTLIKSIQQLSANGTGSPYFPLEKGQNIDQCLPLISWAAQMDDYSVKRAFYAVYQHSGTDRFKVGVRWGADGTNGNRIRGSVIEFNKDRVKIQRGVVYLSGSTISVNIDAVDLTKTFVYFTTANNCSSDYANRVLVAHRWVSSTTIEFSRESSSDSILVSYFVVECLDDSWIVEHITNYYNSSLTNYGISTARREWQKSIFFGSYTSTYTSMYYSYVGARIYRNADDWIQLEKQTSPGAIGRISIDIVTFSSSNFRVFPIHLYMGSSETTDSRDIKLPENPLDLNRSFIYNPVMSNTTRGNSISSSYIDNWFWCYELTDDHTGYAYRAQAQVEGWSVPLAIEVPPFQSHYVSGTVQQGDDMISRKVRLYRKDTGDIMDETTSASGTGEFTLYTSYSGIHYAVCLDADDVPDFNDLIYGSVLPTVISGTFAYNEGWV